MYFMCLSNLLIGRLHDFQNISQLTSGLHEEEIFQASGLFGLVVKYLLAVLPILKEFLYAET